jgi:hypothetical protein
MPKSVPTALGPFFDLNPLDENLLAPAPNPELELEPNAEPTPRVIRFFPAAESCAAKIGFMALGERCSERRCIYFSYLILAPGGG